MWHSVAAAILVAWLIGLAVLSTRLIGGVAVLAALRRSARPVEIKRKESADVLEQVRARLGVGRLPVIASSPRLAGPAALGVLKPTVILPEGWFETVPAESLRDLLIHECAHLVRWHPMIGILQRVAELFYWPHPLVHILNHRLSRAREEVCDGAVISQGDAIAYARTLLALAERFDVDRRPKAALALMNPRWNLEHRVAGLLDPRRNHTSRAKSWKLGAVAVTLVLTSAAVAAIRWEEPQPAGKSRTATADQQRNGEAPIERELMRWPIPGIVVDEAGKPVGGASVRILSDRVPVEDATTGSDGLFVIQASDPTYPKARLIATSDDGRRQGTASFSESTDSHVRPTPARIVLKPSRIVTVTVIDQAGKPIPDAAVETIAGYNSVAMGKTDAAGHAPLRYPQGKNVQWIIALKPGAGFDYYENYRTWPSKGGENIPEAVTLVLNGAETVRVKAIDSQGHAVPGVVVRLNSPKKRAKLSYTSLGSSRVAWARTNSEGIAIFDWLPPDRETDKTIALAPGSYFAPGRPMLETERKSLETTLQVVRETLLRGKVVKPDVRPASGILVEARGEPIQSPFAVLNAGGSARAAADGTYRIVVEPDHSYMVGIFDQNWAAKARQG
jgi:beta-lactamase regulating signal transducer with metallopeptidase domain